MKIAVVGAGVSGLVAAHGLARRHDVVLFEASRRLGGHANTVDVELDGERLAVDTGFIVYNETTYPHFTRLLARLGVATQPSDMSFGLACERTGLEWSSRGVSGVFAQRRNLLRPSFLGMLREAVRFNREARALLASEDEKLALGDWLCGAGYSAAFAERYIVPMGAAIWSADPAQFLRFPALSFARFFENHGLLGTGGLRWRVIAGGSRRYVEALAAPLGPRIRSGCPVRAVRRTPRGVELAVDGGVARFDRVVLAVHSDQALRLLAGPTPAERQVLASIGYQENRALLHTDASVMPGRRAAWASWNYRIPREPRGRVFVTYHMNRLQNLPARRGVFVTLNGGDRVDPSRVLARFTYHHPVFDSAAMAAQRHRAAIDGVAGVHYCGAWWGFGFHEDGVRSAVEVCRALGVEA